jgi:hypothetical protein
MSQLPVPSKKANTLIRNSKELVRLFRHEWDSDETSRYFRTLPVSKSSRTFQDGLQDALQTRLERLREIAALVERVESDAAVMFGVSDHVDDALDSIYGIHPCEYTADVDCDRLNQLIDMSISDLMNAAANSAGGRNRSITKKSFFIDRQLDLCCHALTAHPNAVIEAWKTLASVPSRDAVRAGSSVISQAVGVGFGRWDIRKLVSGCGDATNDGIFGPLPALPPAALAMGEGSESRSSTSTYPVAFSQDGILVDATESGQDIVQTVRHVVEWIWLEGSAGVEQQICEILSVRELREYFRKSGTGGFWDDHISRYSKSRRKAPIYWLLQSSKKNYALWLYYHRLDKDLLFKALVNYVEPKIRLETSRLESLRSQKAAAGDSGTVAKRFAKDVERQEEFLSELRDFEDKLRRAANLHLEPDLNDGVVLNIAPLWELVPWKEAKKYWDELMEGQYEWSSIGKQLRQKGLVK